jgi:hypothetical protein
VYPTSGASLSLSGGELIFGFFQGVLSGHLSMSCSAFFFRSLRLYKASSFSGLTPRRTFHSTPFIMSDISVQLTAPNGRSYTQPIGLFINNEFVAAKSGEKFATVNPSYVYPLLHWEF